MLSDYLDNINVIEDLLDDEAKGIIADALGIKGSPKKAQIKRFFQEKLATNKIECLGKEFKKRAKKLIKSMSDRLTDT